MVLWLGIASAKMVMRGVESWVESPCCSGPPLPVWCSLLEGLYQPSRPPNTHVLITWVLACGYIMISPGPLQISSTGLLAYTLYIDYNKCISHASILLSLEYYLKYCILMKEIKQAKAHRQNHVTNCKWNAHMRENPRSWSLTICIHPSLNYIKSIILWLILVVCMCHTYYIHFNEE